MSIANLRWIAWPSRFTAAHYEANAAAVDLAMARDWLADFGAMPPAGDPSAFACVSSGIRAYQFDGCVLTVTIDHDGDMDGDGRLVDRSQCVSVEVRRA